jgi:Uma2 family endonuclease
LSQAPHRKLTEHEYLAWELAHDGKHEYVNGEVLAMAGTDPSHDRVVANLVVALTARLRGGPCRVHTADLRVRIDETGLYAYPDLTVVCGEPVFAPTRPATLLNPTLVVEVLSPTTAAWDTGGKAAHYRRRESLRGHLLVTVPDRRIELYERRPADRWLLTPVQGEEATLRIEVLDLDLPLGEVFDGVAELERIEAALDR